jgi:transposase
MAERFVNVDRQTPMFLPPDLREWAADNELAHLILEAVELCDMRAARCNVRGSGSEQYPPTMMLALLIYAYATGLFSSRRIERATYESVAVRYLCANHHPDHDTIAKFRREKEALFRSCFSQVLLLAQEAGVLRVGAVSVDGTRVRLVCSGTRFRPLRSLQKIFRPVSFLIEATRMAGFDLRPGTCAARVPSVDTRNNPPADPPAICFPILPVFVAAHRVIAPFAMDKQNREVNDVEVWQRVFEPGGQTPRQRHQ